MPRIQITKELTAKCQHKPNRKRGVVLGLIGTFLAASITGLIIGCVIELKWLIIVGILGIAAGVLGMIIIMDYMRKTYIQSQDQGYTVDRVTIIKEDDIKSSILDDEIKVMRVV